MTIWLPFPRTITAAMPTLTCLYCGGRKTKLHYDALADKWVCEPCLIREEAIQCEASRSTE